MDAMGFKTAEMDQTSSNPSFSVPGSRATKLLVDEEVPSVKNIKNITSLKRFNKEGRELD